MKYKYMGMGIQGGGGGYTKVLLLQKIRAPLLVLLEIKPCIQYV